MRIRAVCTDIDGTLTGGAGDLLSLDAIKTIRGLGARGMPVILASGNAYPTVRTLRRYLGCSDGMICESGALVAYGDAIRVLSDRDRCVEALRLLKEKFGDRIQEVWSSNYFLGSVAIKRTVERDEVFGALSGLRDIRVFDSGYAYHILEGGVDKGQGLRALCEMMGLEPAEVASIGDSALDLEMLQASAFGIALGNSPAELKRIADYVTSKADGEGFCEAVQVILEKAE